MYPPHRPYGSLSPRLQEDAPEPAQHTPRDHPDALQCTRDWSLVECCFNRKSLGNSSCNNAEGPAHGRLKRQDPESACDAIPFTNASDQVPLYTSGE